jgi:hypothetical protein
VAANRAGGNRFGARSQFDWPRFRCIRDTSGPSPSKTRAKRDALTKSAHIGASIIVWAGSAFRLAGSAQLVERDKQMTMRDMLALSLGFAGVLLATHSAQAQSQCGPRAGVVAQLADQFGETRRSMGLAANTTVMEVYANDETGTWTIALTMPDGVTCLVAAGQSFETLNEPLPAKGDKI